MAYLPIHTSASAPVGVRDFVRRFVDMQFEDVHCMLKLPQPDRGLNAGCHFAVTTTLLSIVSGVATVFYDRTAGAGDGFRRVMDIFYPWNEEPGGGLSGMVAAQHLWEYYRCPLAHSLATDTVQRRRDRIVVARQSPTAVAVAKQPLREFAVQALERTGPPPPWLTPTLVASSGCLTLYPHALYRGTRRMLERLTSDAQRMSAALEFMEELTGQRQPPAVAPRPGRRGRGATRP